MTDLITTRPTLAALVPLVTNSVTSPESRRAYARALRDFFRWVAESPLHRTLRRETVQEYRAHLEEQGKSGSSINQILSAIKKLATEAAESGYMPEADAQAIARIPGVKRLGVRQGNWLDKREANALLKTADAATLTGKRDRAVLALVLGCGLRRHEAVRANVEDLQKRDGHHVLVDIIGKGGRVRTAPVREADARVIMDWIETAGLKHGCILQRLDRHTGRPCGPLSVSGVYWIVKELSTEAGTPIAPHDLRRTFARLAKKGGADLDQIGHALGHEDPKTTRRYLGDGLDLDRAACDRTGLEW